MSSVCTAIFALQALANFSDLDDYYDVVDCLEEQGMERIMHVCCPFVCVLVCQLCTCMHNVAIMFRVKASVNTTFNGLYSSSVYCVV